jgi:hypothetical protein
MKYIRPMYRSSGVPPVSLLKISFDESMIPDIPVAFSLNLKINRQVAFVWGIGMPTSKLEGSGSVA